LALIKFVWKIQLRGVADKVQYVYRKAKAFAKNSAFVRKHPDFTLPPAELVFEANHNVDWDLYLSLGQDDARRLAQITRELVPPPRASVLEWGCGPARIIRHLASCLPEYSQLKLFGSDNNAKSIAWCRQNIPNAVFVGNNLLPPIELGDGSLDLIYAISIFTHLSESATHAWLDEMNRLLRRDGYFLFTTHGENFRILLTPDQIKEFDSGKLVMRKGDAEGKKLFGSFHPRSWVENALARSGFKCLAFTAASTSGFGQDFWVVQKTR
jgi:SAM-dependent methyltransferase